ncbi:MAG: rhombosortase [Lysobacterales bacterium]|jgi:rhomboid family GlyGly-CTERM serine protease|nr:MAG: rhombosortase [Xanthomonadales bacterium]
MRGALSRLAGGRWADASAFLTLAALMTLLQLAPADTVEALRYQRDAVATEPWRLVTGHLVHADAAHFGWNMLGLLIVGTLFARDYRASEWLVIVLASTTATSIGFLLFEPGLAWYVGFSGVLHGCMTAGLVAWLRSSRDWLTALVAALFVGKLAWEHAMGPLPFTASTLSLPVVYPAHTYGAVGGLVAGLWYSRSRPRDAASL